MKTDPVIEKRLPGLRNFCNEFERKVIAQEEWADKLAMLFWALLVLFVLWLIFDEGAIAFLFVGFICFTSELFAFLFGAAFLLYGPRSKANSMRKGLNGFQKSLIYLEKNEVRDVSKIWSNLGLVDGLGGEGQSIVHEVERKYLEKHPAEKDLDSYLSSSYQVRKEIEEWERDNPLLQEFDNMMMFTTVVGTAIVFICVLIGVIFLILLFGT